MLSTDWFLTDLLVIQDELFEHTTHADVDPGNYLPWLLLSDNERDSYSSETDDEPMIDSNPEFYIQDMAEMMDDDDLSDRSWHRGEISMTIDVSNAGPLLSVM